MRQERGFALWVLEATQKETTSLVQTLTQNVGEELAEAYVQFGLAPSFHEAKMLVHEITLQVKLQMGNAARDRSR